MLTKLPKEKLDELNVWVAAVHTLASFDMAFAFARVLEFLIVTKDDPDVTWFIKDYLSYDKGEIC